MIMQLLFVTSTMLLGYSTIRLNVCIYRYSAAGPDLADVRPWANHLVRPLTHCYEEKMEQG